MFFRCPKEYYLHYYASAGGHELHASPKARLLHRLRNMVDMPVYIDHLMITVLHELFINGCEDAEFFSPEVEKLLQKEFTDMLLGRCEYDHKLLLLRELTLPGANHIALKSELCHAVRCTAAQWQKYAAPELLAVPIEQRIFHTMPLAVELGEMNCFCTPCAVWMQGNVLNIAESGKSCEERLLLHALYAMNRYGIAPDHLRSFAVEEGKLRLSPLPDSFSGARQRIKRDLDEMMLPGRTGDIYCEEDFSADHRHCEKCRFRIYCS